MIDTFNDNENSLVFTTNPAGIRRDVAITQDGVGEAGSWESVGLRVNIQQRYIGLFFASCSKK